ncbi:ATP-binding cassette subfamily C member 8 [Tanacetum coccineum]
MCNQAHTREPEVKRDGKEVHGSRERDDGCCPLLEDLKALFAGFEIHFLAKFDYQLEYKPGKANVVVDALSRKAEFAVITQSQFFLQDQIKEGLEHDPLSKKLITLAKDGRTHRFWLKGDMLFTKGDQLYVPKWGDLRRAILKECHDSKWAGHPRIMRTLTLVEGTYYWPRIGDDVETFVRTSEIHGALLDGVVQDHRDGFELLHEFSSPNRRANGEGECTIRALSLALSTGKSPFELVTGRQPLTPNALVASYEGSSPTAYKTMKEWHEQADLARASLDKAAKKMKK